MTTFPNYIRLKDKRILVRNREDVGTTFAVILDNMYGKLSLRPSDIVLDAGAHIGAFSLSVSHLVRRIIALEPNLENHQILLNNLKINKIQNVVALSLALGDPGEGTMLGSGVSSRLARGCPGQKTKVICLDDLCSSLGVDSFDVIKMDIEGAEEVALLGQNTLGKTREIIVEAHGLRSLSRVLSALAGRFSVTMITPLELFRLSLSSWKSDFPDFVVQNARMEFIDVRRYAAFFIANLLPRKYLISCGSNFILYGKSTICQ